MESLGTLYHWSPASRRNVISRTGLQPRKRPTVTSGGFRQPHVCLSPTPSMAWSLSGARAWVKDIDEWDLWAVRLTADDEVVIRPSYGNLIEEVHVRNRIPKRQIWYVGTRSGTSR